MNGANHTTIVGGGIVGLSVAWELRRRGMRVTLIDRAKFGRATSWAGAGILPPANLSKATDAIDQLRGLSDQIYPRWVDELESETGIDIGFRRCGGWYLADTKGEHAAMLGMKGYWDDLGIQCERVAPDRLADVEPALADWASRSGERSAWWVPAESRMRPPRFLRALQQACANSGVELIEHAEVLDVRSSADSAQLLIDQEWVRADSVVICSGAWSGQVARSLGLQQSIVPIRGQMVLLKTDQPLLHPVVNVGHRYLVTRDDGHVLVGSCEEEVGFELGTTSEMIAPLVDFARSLVPKLRSADEVKSWSGLRPMTFDGFPMIGRVPNTANVFVAAGHFRSGLHLAPATAIVISDLLTDREPTINIDSFRIARQDSDSSHTSPLAR